MAVWRDFFYFSKGERRALILLLSLIICAGVILILTQSPPQPEETEPPATAAQTDVPDTSAQTPSSPQPKAPPARKRTYTPSRTTAKSKETISERVKRQTSLNRPPRAEKYTAGTTVELNTADTTELKKIPGIGSAYANRIVKYRNLLGGYYSITQLREVYGVDEEKYEALYPWFTADNSFVQQLSVNTLPEDSLRRHPYISYQQARAINQLRRQKKYLSGWENLQLLTEFTEDDWQRLSPYLSFE
jgi:competence ComEA-like helix-hairpin-helix protein